MAYLNFTKITPPPNDELVNEATQLNANWDYLETKLVALQGIGTFSDQEIGQEAVLLDNGDLRLGVWQGTDWRMPDSPNSAWSAWTAFPLPATSPVARTSFTPRYRINTGIRMGELTGGLQIDGAASAWTSGSLITASNASTGVLGSTYSPGSRFYIGDCATSIPTSNVAGGQWVLDSGADGWRLRVRFMGTSGGGNFLQLNGIRWFY